MIIIIIIMFTN